ncbi:MAG: PAS domain-containing protein [Alphaproteobacteria bacterium]|nr:PAS domain-containing protein [Alphaproteobacteria bacterium]
MSFRSSSPPFRHIEFEHEQAASFADYWYSLPKRDLIPSRCAFDPCTQGPILATYIIQELVSQEFIKLRLVGTKHREGFGSDVTGRNYLDFVEPERRPKAARAIHLVCTHPCGMLVRLVATTEAGLAYQNETFALPMRDNDGVARLVYYQSNSVPRAEHRDAESDKLRNVGVARRTFIDIGAGVPAFEE